MSAVVVQGENPADTDDIWWERAVIAAVLQGYNDLGRLKRIVGKDDFWTPAHSYLWHLCVELDAAGEVPTVALIVQRLGKYVHRLPNGPVYLTDLASAVGVLPIQAEHYALELRRCSIRRQAKEMSARIAQAVDEGSDPDDILALNQGWLDEIRKRRDGLVDDGPSALETVINNAQHGVTGAPTTPWSDIDSLIGGWYGGAVSIVAARPGVGKTLFAENAVTDMVRRHNLHALFVSLEMTEVEITQRTLAHTAGVNLSNLRAGRHHLSERDWAAIERAVPKMEADREFLTIQAGGGQTLLDIKAGVVAAHRRAARAGGRLALVAVDYIQRVRAQDPRTPRHVHLGDVVDGIKDLAMDFGFHGLVPAQLNRNPEGRNDKRPQMSEIRESGSIEQTADNVFLLNAEEVENGGKTEETDEITVHLAKQRGGPTGLRTLIRMGEYARLTQPEKAFPPPTPLRAVKD